MKINVLEYLESSVKKFPDKVAFVDSQSEITFDQLMKKSKAIGTKIALLNKTKHPIAIYLGKGINCITTFLAVAYSGNFYVPIDYEMPIQRINKIMNTLQPIMTITDRKLLNNVEQIKSAGEIVVFEDALETQINEERLNSIQSRIIDTDPLYVLFTSGSTGIPKGVTICHRSNLLKNQPIFL